jgi:hypothetical protein
MHRVIIQAVFGLFVGVLADMGIGGVISAIGNLLPVLSNPVPPMLTFLIVLFVVLPIISALAFASAEGRAQEIKYREANNRCLNCGYYLKDIRRIGDRCPECGHVFRKP